MAKQTIEINVPDGMKAIWNDKDKKVDFIKIDKFETINCHADLYQTPFNKKIGLRSYYVNKDECGKVNAFIELINLRDYFRDGWEPDWNNLSQPKFYICKKGDEFDFCDAYNTSRIFCFRCIEDAERFLDKFKNLFERAGDLI